MRPSQQAYQTWRVQLSPPARKALTDLITELNRPYMTEARLATLVKGSLDQRILQTGDILMVLNNKDDMQTLLLDFSVSVPVGTKRSQLFDTLGKIMERYDQSARNVIQSMRG